MPQNISRPEWDVVVVGGGPAGSVCAALCAGSGMRVLLLERARFPRDKVCGDCLNPLAWPVLDRLGVRSRLEELPHTRLRQVEFVGCDGETISVTLEPSDTGEIAIRRRDLDEVLLQRAAELGTEVHDGTAVTAIRRANHAWRLESSAGSVIGRTVVAADGRNSTIARLLGLMPAAQRDRVSIQTHLPLPADLRGAVRMQFLPEGYSGIADISDAQANLCLVARPENLDQLRSHAAQLFEIAPDQAWRSITPLSRRAIPAAHPDLLLVGDAARVVEPFTGEGIAYAIRTGALAADALIHGRQDSYASAHARLYRGRLWLNQLAKFGCLHPQAASALLRVARRYPSLLDLLTHRVIQPRCEPSPLALQQ